MFDSNSQMHLILSSMLNMMGKGQSKSVRIKNGITIIRKTHRSIQIRNEFGKCRREMQERTVCRREKQAPLVLTPMFALVCIEYFST